MKRLACILIALTSTALAQTTFTLSEGTEARFYIDTSIGNRQEYAYSLFLDTRTGDAIKTLKKSDWTRGDQAWGTSRFLHTGEYFGFLGQTLAGLASLLACFLVYTGIVLAWKRLITKR